MSDKKTKIGLCVTGSFCTFKSILTAVDSLVENGFDVTPIFSFNVANLDTRFFKAADFESVMFEKTGRHAVKSIVDAEPMGAHPDFTQEIMLIAPCTGNTLAKIANAITDTPVTMAVKAHLRNNRPLVISLSSNDALGANARNLGALMNTKNIYFVPFGQDAPNGKPNSLIADTSLIAVTCKAALNGEQLEPVILK